MSKHVRSGVSKSMRIKAIYPGSGALFALWSSLSQSVSRHFNPLLAVRQLYATRPHTSLHSCLLAPLPAPLPRHGLIKGWVEGSWMWRWTPAEACSPTLKGMHVGLHPLSSPSSRQSFLLRPGLSSVFCVASLGCLSLSCPLLFPPSCEAALCTANCTGLGCFTLER